MCNGMYVYTGYVSYASFQPFRFKNNYCVYLNYVRISSASSSSARPLLTKKKNDIAYDVHRQNRGDSL